MRYAACVGLPFVGLAVDSALHRPFLDGLVADVSVHELAARRPERFEVVCEGDPRQVPLEVVAIALPPVRRMHDAVHVLPDVVLRDLDAVSSPGTAPAPSR